jgi:hypothetical protein
MRHINVKLDDEDWRAFERLRSALNNGRRQPLTISTVLRLVVRAGIDATETVAAKAAQAPVQPPKDVASRWEAHVARLAREREENRADCNGLYEEFERRCDQAQLTPHQVAEELKAIDPSLRPAELNAWYYRGEAPSDAETATRLLRAIAKWLGAD